MSEDINIAVFRYGLKLQVVFYCRFSIGYSIFSNLLFITLMIRWSWSFQEDLRQLRKFWTKIREYGLMFKIRKTLFLPRRDFFFFGFISTTTGVKPDESRTIRQIPDSQTRKELQKFIGLCTYYWRFYKSYTNYLELFRELISSKKIKFYEDNSQNAWFW